MNTRLSNTPRLIRGRRVAFALLAALTFATARAEDPDPPGRVARLAVAEGSVSLQPAGVQDWTNATLNRPLTTGDKLWADQDSHAELDIGAAAIRLGPTTGFSFLNLDDNTVQMQVSAGTLIVRVRDLAAGQSYEVDTPNVAVSLQQPGEYRVEVNDAGDTTVVKVSQGRAEAQGGGQSVSIGTQQLVRFVGTDTLTADSGSIGAPDELDSWSAARERQLQDSASRQYVAEDVAGTQDLDNNGRWQETPEYGYVWTPTAVEVGWAPYRFGHWVWIAPWGWTWVDDARWGYAPFHYGRWVTWNDSWCWVPGPRRVRPVYAPALVAWVGGGAAVGVAVGANVGWFPLGPREVFVPGYRVSPTYVRQVNVTNTTIVNNTYITNVYQNNVTNVRYVNNNSRAVTAVSQTTFASGQRVGGRDVRLSGTALQGATVSAAAPAIVPARQSVLGPAGARNVARPPATLAQRTVTARIKPPQAPVPFERQVAAIRENGGRPLARADLARLEPSKPAAAVRVISPSGNTVNAGALPRASVRPGVPSASAPGSIADRERVLQNGRIQPQRSDRPAGSREESGATAIRPVPPGVLSPRVDRPNDARGQGESAAPRPPAAPAAAPPQRPDRPVAPQPHYTSPQPAERADRPAQAPRYTTPPQPSARPAEPQPQEQRYRAPPPAPERAAPPPPSQPPVNRPAPPPPSQAPVNRPAPPPPAAAPANRPPPQPQRQESRDSREGGPHGDRNSRDRADR